MAAWNYAWGDDIFGGTGWLVRTGEEKARFFRNLSRATTGQILISTVTAHCVISAPRIIYI